MVGVVLQIRIYIYWGKNITLGLLLLWVYWQVFKLVGLGDINFSDFAIA